MEEEEAKESRKCAGSGTLDRSEKFGQDRDTLGFPRSTSSGRFGNDRVYGSSRSFKGVFRILPLLIEFARKMYLYLKYLEFVQKDLYPLFEKKNAFSTVQIRGTMFHRTQIPRTNLRIDIQLYYHLPLSWKRFPHISNSYFLQIPCPNGNF